MKVLGFHTVGTRIIGPAGLSSVESPRSSYWDLISSVVLVVCWYGKKVVCCAGVVAFFAHSFIVL